jgi:hypothetical protein
MTANCSVRESILGWQSKRRSLSQGHDILCPSLVSLECGGSFTLSLEGPPLSRMLAFPGTPFSRMASLPALNARLNLSVYSAVPSVNSVVIFFLFLALSFSSPISVLSVFFPL